MNVPKLVIFDCDGVLIDSEIVVCRLGSEAFTRLGHPLTLEDVIRPFAGRRVAAASTGRGPPRTWEDVIRRFAGRPEREMITEIEHDWGRPVPPEYFDQIRAATAEAYATELRAVPGARETLGRIRIPVCVASSSYPEKLRLGLESVDLHDRFDSNLVSATFVAHGKPEP